MYADRWIERLTLLLTMLRYEKIEISKLEQATSEVMVQIPKERIPLLEEIYRVAKQEERLRRGEIRMPSKFSPNLSLHN